MAVANELRLIEQQIDQHDWADKLNASFVDLFCQQIQAIGTVESLRQCLEENHFSSAIVDDNLNLPCYVFEEDDDETVSWTDKFIANQNQMTPFLFAIYKGRTEIVQFLLDNYQANLEAEGTLIIDQKPVRGVSALLMAVNLDNFEMTSLLLRYGADINHCIRYVYSVFKSEK